MKKLAEPLLFELNREVAVTRRLLERIPADQMGWKPHERSMSMGELASHLTNIAEWTMLLLTTPEIDIPADAKGWQADSPAALLERYDQQFSQVNEELSRATDEALQTKWTLSRDGTPMIRERRVHLLRFFIINHMVHHRGQLSVYLRLKDIPVPSIYGASADEEP